MANYVQVPDLITFKRMLGALSYQYDSALKAKGEQPDSLRTKFHEFLMTKHGRVILLQDLWVECYLTQTLHTIRRSIEAYAIEETGQAPDKLLIVKVDLTEVNFGGHVDTNFDFLVLYVTDSGLKNLLLGVHISIDSYDEEFLEYFADLNGAPDPDDEYTKLKGITTHERDVALYPILIKQPQLVSVLMDRFLIENIISAL